MNSFLDSESLAVRTPLDENAMVVVDIAPETFVLLRGEVLRAPDEDSSIFGAACQVFSIGTQIKIFIIKVIISKLEITDHRSENCTENTTTVALQCRQKPGMLKCEILLFLTLL